LLPERHKRMGKKKRGGEVEKRLPKLRGQKIEMDRGKEQIL